MNASRIVEIDENGSVLGEWIDREGVSPFCNIYRRRWRTKDGSMNGTWVMHGSIPNEAFQRGIMWWFPVEVDEPIAPRRRSPYPSRLRRLACALGIPRWVGGPEPSEDWLWQPYPWPCITIAGRWKFFG